MEWTRGQTIGRGSSAAVSLATDARSGETFAVKSVDLAQSEFLRREQRILSSINSPHVVSHKGAEVTSEGNKLVYNLLMEYVAGGTVADAIYRQGGRLGEATIRHFTRQIVKGLVYLHSIGLAHCDIKGSNILVGDDGVKIGDLGCAKWINSTTGLLESGGLASRSTPIAGGTPAYMAPEVARGAEQGFPADIWALGCTVIEMATGASPWPGIYEPLSVLYRVGFAGESPEIPSFLSEQGKDFLGKCLRGDPRERWTAHQLLKHPFLEESNVRSNLIKEANRSSPTTVLEKDFWEEIEESAELGDDQTEASSISDAPAERIRMLSADSGMPSWRWDDNWAAVRRTSNGDDSNGDETCTICQEGVLGISDGYLTAKNRCFGQNRAVNRFGYLYLERHWTPSLIQSQ